MSALASILLGAGSIIGIAIVAIIIAFVVR